MYICHRLKARTGPGCNRTSGSDSAPSKNNNVASFPGHISFARGFDRLEFGHPLFTASRSARISSVKVVAT